MCLSLLRFYVSKFKKMQKIFYDEQKNRFHDKDSADDEMAQMDMVHRPMQKISTNDFETIQEIGIGAYSRVYLYLFQLDYYAMKVIQKSQIQNQNQERQIIQEKEILQKLKNEFLIDLHFAFQSEFSIYLITEHMEGGDLHKLLKKKKTFSEDETKFYIAQIILALEYLHQNHIIYRDLKLQNILIGRDGYIKLGDFGLSKTKIFTGTKAYTICGTPKYMAPEVLQGLGYDKRADWWSLVNGCIMYEMLSGEPPFSHEDRNTLFQKIIKVDFNRLNFKPETTDFINQLLKNNPSNRIGGMNGAKELKSHHYFQKFDWIALKNKKQPSFYKCPRFLQKYKLNDKFNYPNGFNSTSEHSLDVRLIKVLTKMNDLYLKDFTFEQSISEA